MKVFLCKCEPIDGDGCQTIYKVIVFAANHQDCLKQLKERLWSVEERLWRIYQLYNGVEVIHRECKKV